MNWKEKKKKSHPLWDIIDHGLWLTFSPSDTKFFVYRTDNFLITDDHFLHVAEEDDKEKKSTRKWKKPDRQVGKVLPPSSAFYPPLKKKKKKKVLY